MNTENEKIQLITSVEELVTDMEKKNIKIDELINNVASKTLGVDSEQIEKARKKYHNDPRSLDEIKRELEELARKIEERMDKQKDTKTRQIKNAHRTIAPDKDQDLENTFGYYKTEFLDFSALEDFVEKAESGPDEPIMTELSQMTNELKNTSNNSSTMNELASMFDDQNGTKVESSSRQMEQEKGKALIKTSQVNNVSNEHGFSSALNLSFILSTVSILGIFITSMLILLSRIFA